MTGATLLGTNFEKANLDSASLVKARLEGASFRFADMSGCRIDAVVFNKCDLTGAVLAPLKEFLAKAVLTGECADS